jgi:hypothetical protein
MSMKRTFQSAVTSAAAFLGLCFFPAAPAMAQGGLGTFHAFYTAADVNLSGDLIHLYTTTSGTWYYDDLTALSHSGPPYQGSPLTSFSDSPGEHVFYLNSDGGYAPYMFSSFSGRGATALGTTKT